MTILEALQSATNYPVPVNAIERFCLDRALTSSTTFTAGISQSQGFQLALADVYFWMYGAPSISEQNISLSVVQRENYLNMANKIYGQYDDPKFSGSKYGFVGEDWNA